MQSNKDIYRWHYNMNHNELPIYCHGTSPWISTRRFHISKTSLVPYPLYMAVITYVLIFEWALYEVDNWFIGWHFDKSPSSDPEMCDSTCILLDQTSPQLHKDSSILVFDHKPDWKTKYSPIAVNHKDWNTVPTAEQLDELMSSRCRASFCRSEKQLDKWR